MKNAQLTLGLMISLLLGASAASAQDYPAADFQPKVLYQDPSIVAAAPAASSPASSASASAPCVSATKEEKAEATDAQYPAANFQPKVLYSAQ